MQRRELQEANRDIKRFSTLINTYIYVKNPKSYATVEDVFRPLYPEYLLEATKKDLEEKRCRDADTKLRASLDAVRRSLRH